MAVPAGLGKLIASVRGRAGSLLGTLRDRLPPSLAERLPGWKEPPSPDDDWVEAEEALPTRSSAAAAPRIDLRSVLSSRAFIIGAAAALAAVLGLVAVLGIINRPLKALPALGAELDVDLLSQLEFPVLPLPYTDVEPLTRSGRLPEDPEAAFSLPRPDPALASALAARGRGAVDAFLETVE